MTSPLTEFYRRDMLAEERRLQIREILAKQRSVSAADLTEKLDATSATIRRDLHLLEQEGFLVRSRGGAVSRTPSTSFQPSYEALQRSNRYEKEAIAAAAEALLLNGDAIFLEGSTTVFELSRRLGNFTRLTVATNSPPIVCQLQRSTGVEVVCTGGYLHRDQFYLSGPWAHIALSEIRVDKAILGITAIDCASGHYCASQHESQVKKMLVKSAKKRIGLADHTKFNKEAFYHVGPITDFTTIITDSRTDPNQTAGLREAGVEVIVVEVKEHRAESTT